MDRITLFACIGPTTPACRPGLRSPFPATSRHRRRIKHPAGSNGFAAYAFAFGKISFMRMTPDPAPVGVDYVVIAQGRHFINYNTKSGTSPFDFIYSKPKNASGEDGHTTPTAGSGPPRRLPSNDLPRKNLRTEAGI